MTPVKKATMAVIFIALSVFIMTITQAGTLYAQEGAGNTGGTYTELGAPLTPGSGFDFSVLSDWEFAFASGAGGWMTIARIEPDGAFSGAYHDSEMGSAGEEYPNGTIYVCNFTGRFTSIQKISNDEYSMKCENLTQEGREGEEKIIDGIKYITATPHGFDNADEFRLYLPGKAVSELPDAYVDWLIGLQEQETIDFYGLYNVNGEQGFSSYQQ